MQVTNTSKDTSLKWFKDGAAESRYAYEPSSGVSTLTFPQVPKPLPWGGGTIFINLCNMVVCAIATQQ